jgi:calnexin
MQADILFDNIYIGHSIEDAAAFRAATFDVKRPIEDAEDAKSKPVPDSKPSSPLDLSFTDDPVTYVKEKLDLFITLAKKDPVEAIKFMPEVAGAIGGGIVLLLAIFVGVLGAGSAAAPSKEDIKKTAQKAKDATVDVKDKAVDAKDKVVDAAASGVDQAKADVNKRTTRSSAGSE